MAKKLVTIGVVLLFLVRGGIFLLVSQKQKQSEYVGKPTQWSRAGDYEMKEVNGQTVVSNKKAGFSFKVPKGWSTENRHGDLQNEYVFNMRSPDAKFQKDQRGNETAILSGCIISFEASYQGGMAEALFTQIEAIKNSAGGQSSTRKLVEIGKKTGMETLIMPTKDSRYYKSFGSTITIEVPIDDKSVVSFGTRIAPGDEIFCEESFSTFTKNITIGI